MELKDYTTEQLRAELKRRSEQKKKDFSVFKKGERYWLELTINGCMYGRSDNIKGVLIDKFPYDQFYDIFTLSIERI